MANTLKLPVGIENFEEIRKLGFYYIDKTRLIEQLLQGWGKVTLFTRPRRFGKTLNMSMLKSFFVYFHSPRFFIMGSQHLHSSMFTHPMNATLQVLCILLLSFLVLAAEESRTPHELFFTS